ncbi:MAG: DUF3306 domain-containing protein [Hyphomicrobiales bacterium]
MATEDDKGFFSRWSGRKRAIAAGDDVVQDDPHLAPPVDLVEPENAEEETARLAELTANREAAEAIDIEALDYDSDYSTFFKEGVPPLLKQKAMRLLWRSNPVLANIDGLCDYDENFGDPSLILEKFESAYQIGKGYFVEDKEDVEEEVASDEALEADLENTEGDDNLADASEQEETADDEVTEPELTTNDNVELAQNETDDQLASDFELEEVALERPRVSLRKRLQFES